MKNTILILLCLCCALPLSAREPLRIHRTEALPYDTRHEAEARTRSGIALYKEFTPKAFQAKDGSVNVGQVVDIPYTWTDGEIYLHLEQIGAAYTLSVNEQQVAAVEDPTTPADFRITELLKEGKNAIILEMRQSTTPQLNGLGPASGTPFAGSYLFCQNKRSIRDFTISLVPDSTNKFGILTLDVIAQNTFNYAEPVTVGYDIYSPQGKLLDFNIVERTIAGRSTDTIRFRPYIYHTNENRWGEGKAPLYKVMLFTKRNGVYKEYMPLRVGFGKTEFIDGKWLRSGKELQIKEVRYNAATTPKSTLAAIKALKAQGKNTLRPDYPQPAWFYELCDAEGMYVIDRANINAPEQKLDRTVGGTPSNDPTLVEEYLERVKAMYYRSRNYTCLIGFSLGGDAGNGYNMYKAYQWLKSVEHTRPVIYQAADGEWNSDL